MAEYIDKEKAIQTIRLTYCKDCNNYNGVRCRACEFDDAMSEIEDCPTADVVEVRHGNAICGDHDEWWGAVYECSLCGEKWMLESSSYKAHYCPWCGAKMDGERKEQK